MRLLAILVTGALAAAVSAAAATKPTLRVVEATPLTLRGTGFRPREAVRVTVRMDARRLARSTRVAVSGRFTVRFSGVRLNYCATPLVIVARGDRTGAVYARVPRPVCAPP